VSKIIWIFWGMIIETKEFPSAELIEFGPQRLLRAREKDGLLVPLVGYKVSIYGASSSGLTPKVLNTVKDFWTRYFSTAGAQLISYSSECDADRQAR
jgi:hypothetical protein